jgi:hypothetical protein
MTMQDHIHPDDERLSALAGGDPEAAGDSALRAHVTGCQRCTSLVRDLGELRVALAQLPDLPPSRPLQLIPPVPEPEARGAGGGWLRRLAAPAVATGLALAVVGGIGFGAVSLSGMGAATGAPAFQEDAAGGDAPDAPEAAASAAASAAPDLTRNPLSGAGSYRAQASRLAQDSPIADRSPIAAPADEGDEGEEATDRIGVTGVDFNQPGPWLVMLAAGVALLLLGLVLRVAISPRAG